jgi:hypothetical protein
MNLALRVTAGAETPEVAAEAIEDRLGKDAARRIAGAQEQDVEATVGHHPEKTPGQYGGQQLFPKF